MWEMGNGMMWQKGNMISLLLLHCFASVSSSRCPWSLAVAARSSCRKRGRSARVAMMHSAAKRQKMSWKGMRGMKIMEMAVKKAADPSISDDTFVTLPFSLMLLPMSIAITVPIMLYGPPMQLPIRNIARQYSQTTLVSAKETMNMTTELKSSSGLRKRARLLQRSTRKPTAVPPMRLPRSIMLAMYPFSDAILPPFSPKKTGSQNSSPQMQPFRQEYPSTYSGTRGRQSTENTPYLRLDCGLSSRILACPPAFYLAGDCSPSVRVEASSKLPSVSSSSGFSFNRRSMRTATPTAKAAVMAKFHTQDMPCSSRRLQRLEAMMLPTLAFMAQIPISTPFLFFENQFPKIPIMPGHPVAWKKPFRHISTPTSTGEKKPLIAKMRGKRTQLRLARMRPAMMQVLRETRWMMLPRAAIPKEQEMRQRASMMPRKSALTQNYLYSCCLEQDHPSRNECRLAYPRKVSRKAVAFSQKLRDASIQMQLIIWQLGDLRRQWGNEPMEKKRGEDGTLQQWIQMRGVGSKEKLQMMHQALDRQLQQIAAPPRSSSSRRDRQELRYTSNLDEPKRTPIPAFTTNPPNPTTKPATFDHVVRESDIRTKKNEIGQLQRKLMELQRKMENVSLESEEEEEGRQHSSLAFREQKEPPRSNQDTARFLLQANREREKATANREREGAANKYHYSYPSLEDQEDEDENSDEDFAVMQRAIERKKQQQAGRRAVNTKVAPPKSSEGKTTTAQRKISTEAESVLKPKYSNEKNKPKPSQEKKSIRDSVTSKKSQEKTHQQPQLQRANSKRSIKSNHSLRRSRQASRDRQDRSFDRFSQKQQCLHSEEMGLAKDLKKMGNLQRQVAHYKRLARKYKQELDEYKVMEMQLKELRKNFAKSQLIRTQQKKVIETLRSKIGK